MEINYRRFRDQDAEACSQTIRESLQWISKLPLEDPIFSEYTPEKISDFAKRMKFFVFFPDMEENLIATGGFRSDGEAKSIYVHPEYKRQGIGRFVMETIESEAIESGLDKLFLWAIPGPSVKFYESIGYRLDKSIAETYMFKKIK